MHSAQLSVLLVALLPLVAGYIIPATHTVTQTFVQGLAGEFSNQAQVQNDPHFKPINVWYRPMEKASEANGITQLVIDRLADFDPSKGELHAWPFLTESAILNQGTEPYKKNVVIVVNAAGRIHLQSFRVKVASTLSCHFFPLQHQVLTGDAATRKKSEKSTQDRRDWGLKGC